mmetsp:Transcript_28333/g.39397  ORF Transcript_28333/g.39397 Transcript_28333/m.39397 type:complete len:92 (+) Transcript_28333:206-481(+)
MSNKPFSNVVVEVKPPPPALGPKGPYTITIVLTSNTQTKFFESKRSLNQVKNFDTKWRISYPTVRDSVFKPGNFTFSTTRQIAEYIGQYIR